jgi:hypothetical protein
VRPYACGTTPFPAPLGTPELTHPTDGHSAGPDDLAERPQSCRDLAVLLAQNDRRSPYAAPRAGRHHPRTGLTGRAYSAVFRASALLPIELCTLKLTASER